MLVEGATGEDLGEFGNHCPELLISKVRFHAVNEVAGYYDALLFPWC